MATRRSKVKEIPEEAQEAHVAPSNAAALAGTPLPPWLVEPLAILYQRAKQHRLPPGLLVAGPDGVGKGLLVRRWLQALACTQMPTNAAPDSIEPCGNCNGCRSFLLDSHPEFLVVTPPEAGKDISIDTVREVIDFLIVSHSDRARMVFLDPGEALNPNAANALLKTLEEPPGGATVILAAARPARLLPTVRSRCEMLRIPLPKPAAMRDWLAGLALPANPPAWGVAEALAAALYRPMLALELLHDPVAQEAWTHDREALQQVLAGAPVFTLAAQLARCDLATFLPRLQILLVSAQCYLITSSLDDFGELFGARAVASFARRCGAQALARLGQRSLTWQREARVALNPQLRCEEIALTIQRYSRGR